MVLDGLTSTVIPQSAVTLTFDLLTRKLNQYVSLPGYIMWTRIHMWPKLGEIPFIGFVRVYKVSGTQRLTRFTLGRTNSNIECLRHRSNGCAGIKIGCWAVSIR